MAYFVLGKVNIGLGYSGSRHRFDKETGIANVILVTDSKALGVLREHNILGSDKPVNLSSVTYRLEKHQPQDRHSFGIRPSECRVPNAEHGVSEPDKVSSHALVWFVEKERLATFGIDMRMCPEERRKDSDLIPADEHLRFRIAKEATDIGCNSRVQTTVRIGVAKQGRA